MAKPTKAELTKYRKILESQLAVLRGDVGSMRDEALRAQIVHHMAEDGLLIEVLGSAASRPGAFGEERVRVMQGLPHIRYRQVLLGFMHQHGVSRWLTHEEICAGVVRAAAGDDVVTVAGQVEPWKLRP